jgi:hypothetical protein
VTHSVTSRDFRFDGGLPMPDLKIQRLCKADFAEGFSQYQVSVTNAGSECEVRITASNDVVIACWSGLLAWHLTNSCSSKLPDDDTDQLSCTANTVWELVLSAAVIRKTLLASGFLEMESSKPIARAAIAIPQPALVPHGVARDAFFGSIYLVAQVIFSHPGEHMTADDLHHILLQRYQGVSRCSVDAGLGQLSNLGVVQCIEVGVQHVFYDSNVVPHAHIFDALTERLKDENSSAANLLAARCGKTLVNAVS